MGDNPKMAGNLFLKQNSFDEPPSAGMAPGSYSDRQRVADLVLES